VIELTLRAVDAEGTRLLSTASRTARIDLALDEALISAVKELVPRMAPIRTCTRSAFPSGPPSSRLRHSRLSPRGRGSGGPLGRRSGAPSVLPPPRRRRSTAPSGSGDAAAVASPLEPPQPARCRPRIRALRGRSPARSRGRPRRFLSTGISAGVHAELQWRRPDSLVGVGLGTGSHGVQAEGPLGSAGGSLRPWSSRPLRQRERQWHRFYMRGGAGRPFSSSTPTPRYAAQDRALRDRFARALPPPRAADGPPLSTVAYAVYSIPETPTT